MRLAERVAVVTGAGSGIGAALARRFVREGARVVLADLDAGAVDRVAGEIGAGTLALGCDVTREDALDELIARTEATFGPVEVFCANAGIGTGSGLDTPDAEWDRVLSVNLRAHVLAARRLVPGWVERGEGYFLATASAAGLITQIGDAPYAVSKHAAVAFAEWLAVTYGAQGVRVSCLCPMGVNTPLLQGGLSEQGAAGLGPRVVAAAGRVLEPEDVADAVVDALDAERFLVLPHPEVLEFVRRKAADYDRWIAGMQRLQAQVTGPAGRGTAPRPA